MLDQLPQELLQKVCIHLSDENFANLRSTLGRPIISEDAWSILGVLQNPSAARVRLKMLESSQEFEAELASVFKEISKHKRQDLLDDTYILGLYKKNPAASCHIFPEIEKCSDYIYSHPKVLLEHLHRNIPIGGSFHEYDSFVEEIAKTKNLQVYEAYMEYRKMYKLTLSPAYFAYIFIKKMPCFETCEIMCRCVKEDPYYAQGRVILGIVNFLMKNGLDASRELLEWCKDKSYTGISYFMLKDISKKFPVRERADIAIKVIKILNTPFNYTQSRDLIRVLGNFSEHMRVIETLMNPQLRDSFEHFITLMEGYGEPALEYLKKYPQESSDIFYKTVLKKIPQWFPEIAEVLRIDKLPGFSLTLFKQACIQDDERYLKYMTNYKTYQTFVHDAMRYKNLRMLKKVREWGCTREDLDLGIYSSMMLTASRSTLEIFKYMLETYDLYEMLHQSDVCGRFPRDTHNEEIKNYIQTLH